MRLLHEAINEAAVPRLLNARGYDAVSVPSPITTTDVLADSEVRTTGHLTAFEIQLLTSSMVARALPDQMLELLTSDMRANVESQLDTLVDVAREDGTAPRLVLAHLMAPHPPFVLGQSADYLGDCFPGCGVWSTTTEATGMSPAEFATRLQAQTLALNQALEQTVRGIIDASPSAFIVILSDHGIRRDLTDVDEHFRTFFAARTPGYDGLFPADISPVNVFRRILSNVFGDDLPDLPYRAWVSDWNRPLVLTERTPDDLESTSQEAKLPTTLRRFEPNDDDRSPR
jgi:hypothetical protein